MDVRQLRYFVTIVEQGALSRAATHLGIAQPALSHHVRNMEEELGTQLLFRGSRGVLPTDSGKILLRHAGTILRQLAIAEEEIRGSELEPGGEVRIGLPGTISEILSVPLIAAAHPRFPKIKLRIAEAMSGFVLDWLRQGRIDLALIYSAVDGGGLATMQLSQEELVFFGRPDGPGEQIPAGEEITFEQITAIPLLVPGAPHGLREQLDAAARRKGLKLNVAMEVESYSNIKELAASGFGFSILPVNSVKQEVASGRLRSWRIRNPALWRSLYLAYSMDKPMTKATSVVLDLIREVLVDVVESGDWLGVKFCEAIHSHPRSAT